MGFDRTKAWLRGGAGPMGDRRRARGGDKAEAREAVEEQLGHERPMGLCTCCRRCRGAGRTDADRPCDECLGSGKTSGDERCTVHASLEA